MTHAQMKTLLLVEDDDNDVMLFRRAWRKCSLDYPVQVVNDGEAAQDYLAGIGK